MSLFHLYYGFRWWIQRDERHGAGKICRRVPTLKQLALCSILLYLAFSPVTSTFPGLSSCPAADPVFDIVALSLDSSTVNDTDLLMLSEEGYNFCSPVVTTFHLIFFVPMAATASTEV